MKKVLIILISLILFSSVSNAQSTQNYYVSSNNLNLRIEPNTKAKIVIKLKIHDNVQSKNESIEGWIKVRFKDFEGYVYSKYLKTGKAVVSSYSVRTGAKCRDGTSSSATGRGACSHHGGVSYLLLKEVVLG